MKDGVTFEVEGLAGIEQAIKELAPVTAKNTGRRVLRKVLKPMADTASKLAPDDPATTADDLHRSIKVSSRVARRLMMTKKSKNFVDMYMGPTGDGYPQAMIQEFGAPHHAAHPYMRPAWEQHKPTLVADIASLMTIEVDKSISRARRKALKNAK